MAYMYLLVQCYRVEHCSLLQGPQFDREIEVVEQSVKGPNLRACPSPQSVQSLFAAPTPAHHNILKHADDHRLVKDVFFADVEGCKPPKEV
ncbi:uncharacterized [Tachysurus ichikawai]